MNGRHPPLARSILDMIGHTPLVELMRSVASRGLTGRLLVKLEYFSPGGSKKARIALEMEIIREARASGELKAGRTVVELTRGITGTGLAIVCRAMGHPFVAVISRGNSVERVRQMEAFGAEVVVVDQAEGAVDGQVSGEDMVLVEGRMAKIVAQRGAFRVDQFRREGNILAHERQHRAGALGTITRSDRRLRGQGWNLRVLHGCGPSSAPAQSGSPCLCGGTGRGRCTGWRSRGQSAAPDSGCRLCAHRPGPVGAVPGRRLRFSDPTSKPSRRPATWRPRMASSPASPRGLTSQQPGSCWRSGRPGPRSHLSPATAGSST